MSAAKLAVFISKAETAERRLIDIKTKFEQLRKIKVQERIQQLTKENAILKTKVANAKEELIKLETSNGKKQYIIPTNKDEVVSNVENGSEPKKVKPEKEKKTDKIQKPKAAPTETLIHVGKLDLRIGKIVDINKHPDADTLYVEKIDCGEEKPRTVVSGLVNHVPIEEMRDRIVMVLCNLKPVKMRGVISEAMVMCASSPEKVEVLIPPVNALAGDLVSCEGFPREPEAQLNPKKKIFETCAPDLKTNDACIACYKGTPLFVNGKGPIVAATLKGVNVK